MVATPTKLISLAEFLDQPETKPAQEYSDGLIRQKPMPKGKHSLLQTLLAARLNQVLKAQGLAFSELRCTFGDPTGICEAVRSIVPDISVFIWDRLPRDASGEIADLFELAPDWAIEILSPDQSPIRVIKNILHGLEYGTQMGWLIDPKEKTVLVYLPNEQVRIIDNPASIIPVPPWASHFSITIDELFGWLMP